MNNVKSNMNFHDQPVSWIQAKQTKDGNTSYIRSVYVYKHHYEAVDVSDN